MAEVVGGRRYWIVKGNKRYPTAEDDRHGDLRSTLNSTGAGNTWATRRRIPKEFCAGDGVFFWSSSPDCFVIGLGEVRDPDPPRDEDDGYNTFVLDYLTEPLARTISLDELREQLPRCPDGDMAYFLKPAAAQTIYPLTPEQAACLGKILIRSTDNQARAQAILEGWGLTTA
jgi:hypothetical protein